MPKTEIKHINKEKEKAMNKALESLANTYGKDVFAVNNDVDEIIPSSSISLNLLLGVGGLPTGRIVEIYGPQGGGKTLMSLDFIANCHALGKEAAFIDAEHSLDMTWAKKLGVDVKRLEKSWFQPSFGESAFDIMCTLISSGAYSVIVLDSVASLVPKVEYEGTLEDTTNRMGLVAKMMATGLRKLTGIARKSNTALLFINQLRDKINPYQAGDVTPGGTALKFYASVRMKVSSVSGKENTFLDNNDNIIGHKIKVDVIKSKIAERSGKLAKFDLYFTEGIDSAFDLIVTASDPRVGLIESKHGGVYVLNKETFTKDSLKLKLKQDQKLFKELSLKTFKALKNSDMSIEGETSEHLIENSDPEEKPNA